MAPIHIAESHIHLAALVNQHLLKWHGDHPLNKECRLDEYLLESQTNGLIMDEIVAVEFDPVVDLHKGAEGCQGAIDEFKFVARAALGKLLPGEGSNEHKGKIKAFIPQAPAPLGPEGVEEFVNLMKKQSEPEEFEIVKGFRYLVQDKPPHTMTTPNFIEALKWFERNDYVFEWGIDIRSGGLWQFEESIEVFKQVPNLKYIINHQTKADLHLSAEEVETNEKFLRWKGLMTEMYKLTPNSYMKLSGGFSELPEHLGEDVEECAKRALPWFKVCFELWGVDRTMWASNWPVCAMIGGPSVAYKWYQVTEKLFDIIHLDQESRQKVYRLNCRKAYNYDSN